MPESMTCPKCGSDVPDNAPAGICPKCLLQAGLAGNHAASNRALERTTASSHFVPPSPEELAEKFPQLEILELLGRGGMGAVYKARQTRLDRLVAVKILPPEVGSDPAFAQRFEREAKALAKLSHQNIVSVFDFGQTDGQFYFVMEYVDGVNLRDLMESGMPPSDDSLNIVQQVCDALQFAHREGVVHRDVKPENILVDKRGQVKIADFGLAKLLDCPSEDFSLTGTRQVMGTPRYMAPEQIEGTKNVDHRADIFSLGVIFYELLTGELPLGRFDPPSKKRGLDARLDEVVLRALEKEPERRYQQASEVNVDIDSISRAPHAPARTALAELADHEQPRFSRKAIVGAVWAATFFVTVLPSVFLISTVRVSTDGAETATASSPLWFILRYSLLAMIPIGLTAPLGATILGLVSSIEIQHSRGRLIGLPLAIADLLLFPLLLLDTMILAACFAPTFVLPGDVSFSRVFLLLGLGVALLIAITLCILVDWLIIRWVWRKFSADPHANGKPR